MTEEKDQFYFQGTYFDTSEQMFKYIESWRKFPLDQETADDILKHLKNDISMIVFLNGHKFTNEEFSFFVIEIFEFSMKRLALRNSAVTVPPGSVTTLKESL